MEMQTAQGIKMKESDDLKRKLWRRFFPVVALLATTSALKAAPDPPFVKGTLDFTTGAKPPKTRSHDWTLGPTGARGWVQVWRQGAPGTTKKSRQIYITSVASGSPADGLLKKGDVIVGVGDEDFEDDARVTFAKAINLVGASDHKLRLKVFRKDKSMTIAIPLPEMPPWSATAPFDCEKSALILKQGCDAIEKRGLGRRFELSSHLNALSLLAADDPSYEKSVASYAKALSKSQTEPYRQLNIWHMSFANIFLCEYYLKTNDQQVKAKIAEIAGYLVKGQGPLGTWGHSMKPPESDYLKGYGAVNAVGVPAAISLALAVECEVEVDGLEEALTKSANYFRRHVGIGGIPYGDGAPSTEYGHDDNGKSSAAAILFSLLGDSFATRYYGLSAIAAHNADREQGHTGNFFNIFWALPAVSLSGQTATGAWMDRFGWYYDLARDYKLTFPYQGYPSQREKSHHAGWYCPGAYLLHFALPKKALRITGRAVNCGPELSPQEIVAALDAGDLNYRYLDQKRLKELLSSWSPIVRKRSGAELRHRAGERGESGYGFTDENPLNRMAALEQTTVYQDAEKMLNDSDIVVRVEALRAITRINKKKALASVFKHLASKPDELPVFTQKVGSFFFPLGISGPKAGSLMNGPADRKVALIAIRRLINDEDALVASRVAAGVAFLPENESRELLPLLYAKAKQGTDGNVMFNNKLRVSSAEVLTRFRLAEGMEVSALLLADDGWGRNARMPNAAKLLLTYKEYAKDTLPELKQARAAMTKPGKWPTLLQDTIDAIEAAPQNQKKLKSL